MPKEWVISSQAANSGRFNDYSSRGKYTKASGSGWLLTGKAEDEDIVCACGKLQEVHKRTALTVAC